MKRILYLGVLALLVAAAQPAFAHATKKVIVCDQTVQKTEELVGEINADIVVKNGKTCVIDSAHIKGNITCEAGAETLAIEGSFIEGSIETNGINDFFLDQTTVARSVKLKGVDDYAEICDSDVLGDLNVSKTSGTVYVGDIKVNEQSPEVTAGKKCLGSRFGKNVDIDSTKHHGAVFVDDNDVFEAVSFKNNKGYEEVKRNDMEHLRCKNNNPKVVTGGIDGPNHNDISKNGQNTCDPPE